MIPEILISPEELYFLAATAQARYIDYIYVAAMKGLDKTYKVCKSEATRTLREQGLITANLAGNVELEPDVLNLLEPVFFGTYESAVDVCVFDSGVLRTESYRFHFNVDNVTCAMSRGDKFLFCPETEEGIRQIVESFVPESYQAETGWISNPPLPGEVTRVFSVKNQTFGREGTVRLFVQANGLICREGEDGFQALNRKDFIDAVWTVVRGQKDGLS